MGGSSGDGLPRRTFLRYGALGAALALPTPVGALCSNSEHSTPFGDSPPPSVELDELSIDDLQRRMASGQETSQSLAEKYLARIAAIDRQGPSLRSVIESNPDAGAAAAALDAERKAGKVRGALHGIPILVKDNVSVTGRMSTTAGSLALDGSVATVDAFIIARLRDALAAKVENQRVYFESQLANLQGYASEKAAGAKRIVLRVPRTGTLAKPKPKYQSKKNKSLKWTGRGMLPNWMREEMKGTKLKKEDLLIK